MTAIMPTPPNVQRLWVMQAPGRKEETVCAIVECDVSATISRPAIDDPEEPGRPAFFSNLRAAFAVLRPAAPASVVTAAGDIAAPFTTLFSTSGLGPPRVRETPDGRIVFVQDIIPPTTFTGQPCDSLEEALEVAETERKKLAAEGWTPRDFDVVGDPD